VYIVHVRIIYSERGYETEEVNNTRIRIMLGGMIAIALLMGFLPFAGAGTYDEEFNVVERVPQVQQIVQANDVGGDGYDWSEINQVPLAKPILQSIGVGSGDGYDFLMEETAPAIPKPIVVGESGDGYDFLMGQEGHAIAQIVVPGVRQSLGDNNDFAYWEYDLINPAERQARETETRIVQECFEYDFCINYIIKDSDALTSADGVEVDCDTYPAVLGAGCLSQERVPNSIPTPSAFEDYP